MENMEDILATLSVETRRVAVRCTAWLDEGIGVTLRNAPGQQPTIEGSQDSLWVTRNGSVLRGHDLPLSCAL